MIEYQDLIGKPFGWGGRGPDHYDCYGLVKECLRRDGVELPDYPSNINEEENAKTVLEAMGSGWTRTEKVPGCVVLFRGSGRAANHVGYMVDGRRFLHVLEQTRAVVVERLDHPLWERRTMGFFFWDQTAELRREHRAAKTGVELVRVQNPFDTRKKEVEIFDKEGLSLSSYLRDGDSSDFVVSVNGKVIPHELMNGTLVVRGSQIVLYPIIRGANVWRSVALIAVSVVAMVVSAGLAGMAVFAGKAWLAALIGAGISIGGSLLINWLIPLPKANADEQTQTYGWEGPQLTARQGIQLPKGYGKIRVSGNLIATYTEIQNDKQYMNLLICFGHGPIKAITEVEINENGAGNYNGVFLERRLGTVDQVPLQHFNRLVFQMGFNVMIKASDTPFVSDGQKDNTESLEVVISFPQGLWKQNDKGNLDSYTVKYKIEYSLDGSGVWTGVLKPRKRVPFPPYAKVEAEAAVDATEVQVDSVEYYGAVPFEAIAGTERIQVTAISTETETLTITRGVGGTTPIILYEGLSITQVVPTYWVAISNDAQVSGGNNDVAILASADSESGHYEGEPYSTSEVVDVVDEGDPNIYQYPDQQPGHRQETRYTYGYWTRNTTEIGYGIGADASKVVEWTTLTEEVSGNKSTATRRVTNIYGLTPGKYNIRITRLTPDSDDAKIGDDMYLSSIKEIRNESLAYPGMGLLGVRALATDQLSGGMPNVTAIVEYGDPPETEGPMKVYTGNNPAMVAWDMMTNSEYGSGIPVSLMDTARFVEWADYCNEVVTDGKGGLIYRHTFNGVFDQTDNLWMAVGKVCAMSRAVVMRTGTKYTVVLDKKSDVTQLFNMGNILEGSFKHYWLGLQDRANSVDITYTNEDKKYKKEVMTIEDEEMVGDEEQIQKAATLEMFGVTKDAEVWREGKYRLLQNKYLREMVEFEVSVDAVVAQVGDLVAVQHDVPKWGVGGRVLEVISSNTVRLDVPFLREAGKTYEIMVHDQTTDALTRALIINDEENSDVVSAETDLSGVAEMSLYSIGETDAAKLFRIQQISKSQDLTRSIRGTEYDARVYDGIDPVLPGAKEDKDAAVTDLQLTEIYLPTTGQRMWSATWRPGEKTFGVKLYGAFRPYLDKSFTTEALVADIPHTPSYKQDASIGDTIVVRVVGYDRDGVSAPYKTAPTARLTIKGIAGPLVWAPWTEWIRPNDPVRAERELTFMLSQGMVERADETVSMSLSLRGKICVNRFNRLKTPIIKGPVKILTQQDLADWKGEDLTAMGRLEAGKTYYWTVAARDKLVNGIAPASFEAPEDHYMLSRPTAMQSIEIPMSKGNGCWLAFYGCKWDKDTKGFELYVGESPKKLTCQVGWDFTGPVEEQTAFGWGWYQDATWSQPQEEFDHMRLKAKTVRHSGVMTVQLKDVSDYKLELEATDAGPLVPNAYVGYIITLIGQYRSQAPVPYVNFRVQSNTATEFYLEPEGPNPVEWSLRAKDTIAVRVRTLPDMLLDKRYQFGDANWANSLNYNGWEKGIEDIQYHPVQGIKVKVSNHGFAEGAKVTIKGVEAPAEVNLTYDTSARIDENWIWLRTATGTDVYSGGGTITWEDYGLIPGAEKGALARILFGKGRGQVRRIRDNTQTMVELEDPWDLDGVPDETSIIVIEENEWKAQTDLSTVENSYTQTEVIMALPVDNLLSETVLVTGVTVDNFGEEAYMGDFPYREIFVYGEGAQFKYPDKQSFALGIGGPLQEGVNGNPSIVTIKQAMLLKAYISAKTPPAAIDLIVDILLNGESIFGDAKLILPAGSQVEEVATISNFRDYLVIINESDTLQCSVIQTDVGVQDVSVVLRVRKS